MRPASRSETNVLRSAASISSRGRLNADAGLSPISSTLAQLLPCGVAASFAPVLHDLGGVLVDVDRSLLLLLLGEPFGDARPGAPGLCGWRD
jgi:hypothetical protein